jgi:hypothetical protein
MMDDEEFSMIPSESGHANFGGIGPDSDTFSYSFTFNFLARSYMS